jgi:hypothetical protein
VCPIFQVSNVTGQNLDLLKAFLNLLNSRLPSYDDEPAEYQIDDTFSVPVSFAKNTDGTGAMPPLGTHAGHDLVVAVVFYGRVLARWSPAPCCGGLFMSTTRSCWAPTPWGTSSPS